MTDDQEPRPERPLLNGAVALIAVALTVGAVMAVVAVIAARMVGLSGDQSSAGGADRQESAVIPTASRTPDDGPATTFGTDDPESDESEPEESESTKPPKEGEIVVEAEETSVPNFGQIHFSGTYPGGDGAVLQVQRKTPGTVWENFDVTVPVSDGGFTSYVQTGVSGVNIWRVVDPETGATSNEFKVKVA